MIGNAKKDNKKSWNEWGKDCDLKIESHTFGYQASEDGYLKNKRNQQQNIATGKKYIVKRGDTLSGIAKKFNTTVQNLMKLNKNIKSKDVLSIGQEIYI